MIPKLLPDTHPLLAQRMPLFEFEDEGAGERARALSDTLLAALVHYEGSGIAANQLGIEARAFAMQNRDGPIVCFNPIITWLSSESAKIEEGCLTFTNLWLTISRPKECQLKYTDCDGETHVLDLSGYEARIALHETDHLDGVNFTSLVSKLRLSIAKKKAKKLKK